MKTRKIVCLIVVLFMGVGIQYVIAEEFDWPRWRGPNGDGISMETDWNPEALTGGPKIFWKKDIGMGYSNVAIKNGSLYTMGKVKKDIIIYCLKADTGEEVWRYVFEELDTPPSTPTVDGNYVYVLSFEGLLLCLNAKNGKLRWSKDIVNDFELPAARYGFATSPVIEGDLIILNANTCIALNKNTGDKVWMTEMTEEVLYQDYYATPVIYTYKGRKHAAIFDGRGLFSVDIKKGKKKWYYEWKIPSYPNAVDPIVYDNKVYISSAGYTNNESVCVEIIRNKPNEIWQNSNMGASFATAVLINGYLYGSDGWTSRIPFRCLDFDTGEIMWEEEMRAASVISANGKLIILEENGILHIAEAAPSAYNEISSCDVFAGEKKASKFWSPPALCNGKIYCRNYYGDLVCIDVSK